MSIDRRQRVTVKTAATVLPLSLNEIKDWLDIADSDTTQDARLIAMLRAVTTSWERVLRRTFVTTTWTLWADRFPGKSLPWWDGVRQMADTELTDLTESIQLPRSPVQTVTSVKGHNQDGTTTTVLATNYIVDVASEPARIALKMSQSWPTTSLRSINGVEVEYVAGYGDAGSDVPEPIRTALLMAIGDVGSNRGGQQAKFEKVGESSISRFDPGLMPLPPQHILDTYKIWKL